MTTQNDNHPAKPNFYAKLALLGLDGGEQIESATLKNIQLFQNLDLQRQLEEDYECGLCDKSGNYYEGR